MRHMWVVAVLVCAVLVSGAWAQEFQLIMTPRMLGMGGTAIGVADDGAAWFQNPAGLGALTRVPVQMDKEWGYDAIGMFGKVDAPDSETVLGGTISGWNPEKQVGWGAGIGDVEDLFTAWGAGAGMTFGASMFSAGINVINDDPDGSDSNLLVNVGGMYRAEQPMRDPIRIGAVIEDITNETDNGPYFHAGVLWPVTMDICVAADVLDITDETDSGPFFNFGAEWHQSNAGPLTLRAGLMDSGDGHDLTLGGGWQFSPRIRGDIGWADVDNGNFWLAGVGLGF